MGCRIGVVVILAVLDLSPFSSLSCVPMSSSHLYSHQVIVCLKINPIALFPVFLLLVVYEKEEPTLSNDTNSMPLSEMYKTLYNF